MKLSATIITLNEEKDLTTCLKSLKGLVDEVIVVDSGSTDKTLAIAKKFGAKIFKRKFDDYASQKNFAAGKSSGDWILSIDADEEISTELASEIKENISGKTYEAFSIPRKNIILRKFIRYARWQPELDRHVWLWKRGSGKWVGGIHEEFVVNGKVGKLKNFKIHYQYETISEFLEMMNKYSSLEANRKFTFVRFFVDPIYNFLVRYFYRLGFLDGWRGFVLSYLMAIYHIELWVKIWEKQK